VRRDTGAGLRSAGGLKHPAFYALLFDRRHKRIVYHFDGLKSGTPKRGNNNLDLLS